MAYIIVFFGGKNFAIKNNKMEPNGTVIEMQFVLKKAIPSLNVYTIYVLNFRNNHK